jgi:hypothetical protein
VDDGIAARYRPAGGSVDPSHYGAGMATDAQRADDCLLCEAARITPWFHEDDVCWIAECEICATPMVVWRHHGTEPPESDLNHMMERLAAVANTELGDHWVDGNMRNIPDHFHAHARPAGGFFGPRSSRLR